MNETDTSTATPARRRRGGRIVVVLFLLALLAVLGWRGWLWWQAQQAHRSAAEQARVQQVQALQSRIDALRRDQRAQGQRIAQAQATNRVLREEILGVGQRAALLEDSIDKLADPARSGATSLHLGEAELLLAGGLQRLQLAGDIAGARHAYALAAGVLDGIDDPGLVDLKQALAQERADLDAVGEDPRTRAATALDAFQQALRSPTATAPAPAAETGREQSWWRRALAGIIRVRPAQDTVAVIPADRAANYAGLQLELTLARAALERRDRAAWRAALARADHWLDTLWPDSAQQRARHARLRALQAMPLAPALPGLGSTLRLLRAQRAQR